ncbi:putative VPS35 endosomal protein sorting factor-like [Blattamonas nauphoetae]|uniref:VPS35 endosomal protein sorting factor-like n=1 Tax=Blattamonas nauphoetae TaxID=2049346 RepID=A0ABQ9XWG9_9EUKA|nr:putative VPS35 endosomal protein sorting factor-like [Blattamonas nauphoetae]
MGIDFKTQGDYEDPESFSRITFLSPEHLVKYSEKDMPSERFILRLEKLNNADVKEQEEILELSFQDVIELAEKRKGELVEAWKSNEKVKSLKIVIQMTKLLTDVTYPYLYPRLFALVCQCLDIFGDRVYERLCTLAFRTAHPGRFSPAEVDSKTKETAQNWLLKISSIRELIPRIFVEASLLRVFSFLIEKPYTHTLKRLLAQTNGIGHPLISAYARAYIAKKGMEVTRKDGDMYKNNFSDFLFQLNNAKSEKRQAEMESLKVEFSKYLRVYSPCMQMCIASVIKSSKPSDDIVEYLLKEHKNSCPDSLLLFHLIEVSPADLVVKHAEEILSRIKADAGVKAFLEAAKVKKGEEDVAPQQPAKEPTAYGIHRLLSVFGSKLCESTPRDDLKMTLLNEVWKMATKISNVGDYLLVADSFIEYPIKHCTDRETEILLKDITKHVSSAPEFESTTALEPIPLVDETTTRDKATPMNLLGSLLVRCARTHPSMGTLVSFTLFQRLAAYLDDAESKELGAMIIRSVARPSDPPITDSVTSHFLFEMAKKAFLWIDSLTHQDEINSIDQLLCSFASKVNMGRDIEQQLTFYVDMRRVFPKFENLKCNLVLYVNSLIMHTLKMTRYKYSKRAQSFIKSCLSYSHVTIPSVVSCSQRIRLLISTSAAALWSGLLGQADVLLQLLITQIQDMPATKVVGNDTVSTDEELVELISEIISLLVVAPGHPTLGPFMLFKGLITMVNEYAWPKESFAKGVILSRLIAGLCAIGQRKLPYHIRTIDSNDVLYVQSEEYTKELGELIGQVVELTYEEIRKLRIINTIEAHKCVTVVSLWEAETLLSGPVLTINTAKQITKCLKQAEKFQEEFKTKQAATFLAHADTITLHLKNLMKLVKDKAEKPDTPPLIKGIYTHITKVKD